MERKILLRTYTNPARLKLLIISIGCFALLAALLFFTTPTALSITIAFILLFFCCYFLSAFLLNNRRRNILIAGGVTTYFLLRFLELRHPFYSILLLALLASLELYFKKD